ncbi:ATP-dependent DNA helicase [Streptomyces sp. NPDC008079]|uniref:ATP-dependent DNA helicase n=1 Tax=Streptomyces sp. NPDC008079 TaxID=3364806 RepID=UPI0036E6C1D2
MLKTFADAQNVLAAKLPGYRRRPQQEQVALAIEGVFDTVGRAAPDGGPPVHLLVEAGTGTGKSLAAAIPAILSGKRVIIATTTNALLAQYRDKDLPFLEGHLDRPVHWAPLKGLGNFLCLAKLAQGPAVVNLATLLEETKTRDGVLHTGDRDDITTPISVAEWREVSATSDECPGKSRCELADACYGMRHRALAADAQVVVTNAAMVMADVKMNRQVRESADNPEDTHPVLGPYDVLVMDEAHELIDIATSQLGFDITQGGVLRYLDSASSFVNIHTDLAGADELSEKITGQMSAIGRIIRTHLGRATTATLDNAFIGHHIQILEQFYLALNRMVDLVAAAKVDRGAKKEQRERQQLLSTMGTAILTNLKEVLAAEDIEIVRWVETYEATNRAGDRKSTRWVIKTAPIDVAPVLRTELWDKTPAVLMSATLTTGASKSFSYVARSLGLPDAKTLYVDSPFDYQHQTLLYRPSASVPSPALATRAAWASLAPELSLELVRAAGGGAMLLYTSRAAMNASSAAITDRLKQSGINVFVQGGGMSNKDIAARFREDEDSVLLGLRSFMTGMDFPGRTNRLVIIDKLPFPVPTDPIFQAREKVVDTRGGEPFTELSVPMMTLILQQAFGRLIRSLDDYGAVAILDSRLASKPYGRNIVASLPGCPETSELADVRGFFARWNAVQAA